MNCSNMTMLRTRELRAVQSRVDSLHTELVTIQKAMQEEQKTQSEIIRQIRGKMEQKAFAREDKTLQRTCVKMSEYVINTSAHSADDVDSLIDDMYRSIICLQKRKNKLRQYKKRQK